MIVSFSPTTLCYTHYALLLRFSPSPATEMWVSIKVKWSVHFAVFSIERQSEWEQREDELVTDWGLLQADTSVLTLAPTHNRHANWSLNKSEQSEVMIEVSQVWFNLISADCSGWNYVVRHPNSSLTSCIKNLNNQTNNSIKLFNW